jgi:hypothetical protein
MEIKNRYSNGSKINWSENFRGDHLHGCSYEHEGDPRCQRSHYFDKKEDLGTGACRYHQWKHKIGMFAVLE